MTVGGAITRVESDVNSTPHRGVVLGMDPLRGMAHAEERRELHAHRTTGNQPCAKRPGVFHPAFSRLQLPWHAKVEAWLE